MLYTNPFSAEATSAEPSLLSTALSVRLNIGLTHRCHAVFVGIRSFALGLVDMGTKHALLLSGLLAKPH